MCDPLAVTTNAAALWLSNVTLRKPVAAAMAGYVDRRLVLNPTMEQMKHCRLNLTVAGTKETVLMIEGAADFLPESLMVKALAFALRRAAVPHPLLVYVVAIQPPSEGAKVRQEFPVSVPASFPKAICGSNAQYMG